jgi:nucleotide-binding universal stress UspA family protein
MNVLIATDGSDLSVHAARRGLELLGSPATVTVLAVLTDVPGDEAGGFEGPVETPEEQEAEWREEQSEAHGAVASTIAAIGRSDVTERVEVGDPGGVIVAVAREIDADVIVLGSHGRGVLKRVFLGSASEHVLHHAPCPVLVIRQGAEHDDTAGTGEGAGS